MALTNSSVELLGEHDTLFEATCRELQRQLDPRPAKRTQEEGRLNTVDRIGLGTFVEATSDLILEPWQNHMCQRLEKLTYQKGQRILLHKPPQHGGSVIVSQRLPAYLIGDNPEKRVRLTCYNIEHATKFGGINKTIMQSAEYKTIFDHKGLYVPARSSDEEFYTVARKRIRDAQASFKALGLKTGFVGQGADDLIIDDPYASPQDAESPAIRKSTWTFWVGSARVRIDEDTNVVVMFHRYGEEDFAGQLIKEEGLLSQGGRWELISYRAEWDEDERLEVGGPDPIDRKKGEYLSPRKARQPGYYNDQKKNPRVWQSQFQGKPSNAEGDFFSIGRLRVIPRPPVPMKKVCRAWDIASSTDGDWTVGVKMGLGIDEYAYVLDVVRFRKNTDDRNRLIRLTAQLDVIKHPDIIFRMPQDPASAGKDVALSFQKLLKGFNLELKPVGGSKELRADPWSQYVNAGLAFLCYSGDIKAKKDDGTYVSWIPDYVEEHRTFPGSTKKDQIDASADAFAEIALEIENPPGEDFDTVGIASDGNEKRNSVADEESEESMVADLLMGIADMSSQSVDFGVGSDHEGIITNGSVYFKNDSQKVSDQNNSTGRSVSKLGTIRERQNARKTSVRRLRVKRANSD